MAGVVRDPQGRILVAQRPPGSHLAGLWEFPGGKREPGESPFEALVRELHEELGIRVTAAHPLIGVPFAYPGKRIHLDVWQVERYDGEPWSREGQALQWVEPSALGDLAMPAADHPVITALHLPMIYRITPDWSPQKSVELAAEIDRALVDGACLIRLRLPQWTPAQLHAFAKAVLPRVRAAGAQLLASDVDTAIACTLDGVHVSMATASQLHQRPLPRSRWFAVSCHDAIEVAYAIRIGADFVTLSPVLATASHPDGSPLGWDRFAQMVRDCSVPVYALGGIGVDDVAIARDKRAQGVAGIGRFWRR